DFSRERTGGSMCRVMRVICALAALIVLARPLAMSAERATDYPARPIRLVVPFVAGGSTDIIARVIGQKVAEQWGRQFVVDNRGGANGVIAMEIVARALPDGYTLVLGYIANLRTATALN